MIKFEKIKDDEINVFVGFHKKLNELIGFKDNGLEDAETLECLKQDLLSEDNYTIIAKEEEAPKTKKCPFCKSDIHMEAVRCPHCTSELESK